MTWSSVGLNLIDCLWSFLVLCFLGAFCAHKFLSRVPESRETSTLWPLFQDLIRFGKTKQSVSRTEWQRVFDVPKRWFWHFYVVSVCWSAFLLVLYLKAACQQQPYPPWLTWTLETLTGGPRAGSKVPQLSTVVLQLLLCVHALRRLLECVFVSVFSHGVIHFMQYAFGLGYYIVLGLTVLCTDFTAQGTGTFLFQLNWLHVAGVALFVGASVLQHQSIVLLARLRTGKSGRVETLAHRMPSGGCFELVSCPHYFAELLIYVSFSLIVGGHSLTWWLVVLYVLFNQALAGQLSHELYVSKYDSYPKHRKAFIPFVL